MSMGNTLSSAPRGSADTASRISPSVAVAVAVLLMAVLSATLVARLTGYDASSVPESPVIESRMLDFRDQPGGVVEVLDGESGELLATIPAGEGSFLRGVVRSLVRQRRGLASEGALFELARHADGRLLLSDPETGERIDLIAFGPTNLAVFSVFLSGAGEPSAAR